MEKKPKASAKSQMPVPTESVEQIHLFQWANIVMNKYPELKLMYHIPNGGQRSITTAKRLKAEGVKAGVPDIHLPVPRSGYHGLYIEMKRLRGGSTTEDQEHWLEALSKQGHMTIVCKGWVEASEVIKNYLSEV